MPPWASPVISPDGVPRTCAVGRTSVSHRACHGRPPFLGVVYALNCVMLPLGKVFCCARALSHGSGPCVEHEAMRRGRTSEQAYHIHPSPAAISCYRAPPCTACGSARGIARPVTVDDGDFAQRIVPRKSTMMTFTTLAPWAIELRMGVEEIGERRVERRLPWRASAAARSRRPQASERPISKRLAGAVARIGRSKAQPGHDAGPG